MSFYASSVCYSCGAWVHPFLRACPACGGAKESALLPVLEDWRAKAQLDGAAYERDIAFQRRVVEGGTHGGTVMPPIDEAVNRYQHKLRYLGWVPGHPASTNAQWWIDREDLVVVDDPSGVTIAAIPGSSIFVASSFAFDESYGKWFGVQVGNFITFTNPTYHSGALNVAYTVGGSERYLALGNRMGMFARKGDAEYFRTMAVFLGTWASACAALRSVEIGPIAYLRELGLHAWADEVAGPSSTELGVASDATTRLARLAALHDQGLISDEEWSAKRAEILRTI